VLLLLLLLLLPLQVKGGPWEACGIGTALWTGPRLTDVLAAAGVDAAAAAAAAMITCSGERRPLGGVWHRHSTLDRTPPEARARSSWR
jgi:hypothetical protein